MEDRESMVRFSGGGRQQSANRSNERFTVKERCVEIFQRGVRNVVGVQCCWWRLDALATKGAKERDSTEEKSS